MIVPVILCGGNGTRLWPRSRAARPKPFLPLVGERTLFEEALLRAPRDAGFAPPVIVTGAAHRPHVEAQAMPIAPDARIIVEPMGRNTAPAIALAAHRLPGDAVMLICPSDHHIGDVAAFRDTAQAAAALADEGWLVAFGIAADRPETGYGYIRQGDAMAGGYRIDRFVEKPDLATAEMFLAEGGHWWNGGLFAFRADRFREELRHHRPGMAAAVAEAVERGAEDGAAFHPHQPSFAAIEGESIDYAVMENTARAAMVPAAMAWSDIGSWTALQEARAGADGDANRDGDGNVVRGSAELVDCRRVMVESDGPRVSVIGLEDIVIVVDGDDILVTSAAGAQAVGTLNGPRNQ